MSQSKFIVGFSWTLIARTNLQLVRNPVNQHVLHTRVWWFRIGGLLIWKRSELGQHGALFCPLFIGCRRIMPDLKEVGVFSLSFGLGYFLDQINHLVSFKTLKWSSVHVCVLTKLQIGTVSFQTFLDEHLLPNHDTFHESDCFNKWNLASAMFQYHQLPSWLRSASLSNCSHARHYAVYLAISSSRYLIILTYLPFSRSLLCLLNSFKLGTFFLTPL